MSKIKNNTNDTVYAVLVGQLSKWDVEPVLEVEHSFEGIKNKVQVASASEAADMTERILGNGTLIINVSENLTDYSDKIYVGAGRYGFVNIYLNEPEEN